MKIAIRSFIATCLAVALPAQAWAADLLYSLTPLGGSGYSANWRMDRNPTPTQVVDGQGFAIERVTGTFPRTTAGDAYLDFFSATDGGGVSISDADGPRILATLYGAQLYSGSEDAPVMRTGNFMLTANQAGGRRYSLTVVDAAAAVPEPGSWILTIGGLALVGAGLRGRRRATVRYA